MHVLPVLLTALSLASGTAAWAKDKNGKWVAHNTWHKIDGNNIHEACTIKDTTRTHQGPCAYWINGNGDMFRGHCALVLGQGFHQLHCRP